MIRWSRLPTQTRARQRPKRADPIVWRCSGVRGCGKLLTHGWADAARHADAHGGARLDVVRDR